MGTRRIQEDQDCYLGVNHGSITGHQTPFILYVDSSDAQLVGLLVQVNPNMKEEKNISNFSWKINPTQLNYSITDKKLLCIMESLKHFNNII